MWWFYGFKLHLVINDCGELLSVKLTPGNTDDRKPVKKLVKGLTGHLYGDSKNTSVRFYRPKIFLIYSSDVWRFFCFLTRMAIDQNCVLPLICR